MWNRLKILLDDKLIRQLRESHAPVEQLSFATAVGVFWALTPLVGIQMMLVTLTWVFFRSIQVKFNLPIAVAWVWLTNPFTMPFFYYAFYMSGYYLFSIFDNNTILISFSLFRMTLEQSNNMNLMDGLLHWIRFLINDLGWPMLAGATLMGIPSAIISYPISLRMINNHREKIARTMHLTLTEWEDRFVFKKVPFNTFSEKKGPKLKSKKRSSRSRKSA